MSNKCEEAQRCIADRIRGFPKSKCLRKEPSQIEGWLNFSLTVFKNKACRKK